MSTTAGATAQVETDRSGRDRLVAVGWFVGLMLGFALIVTLAVVASGAEPTLLAFPLALAPTVISIGLVWREGGGAVAGLLRQVTLRPVESRWWLALLIPLAAFLAVDIVAVIVGTPTAGLFDDLVPAVLIVPLVVAIPAFAEEIGWRGFAVARAVPALSPLRAALVIGVPWTLIHVGLFLPGQMNAGAAYWSMATQIMSMSVLLTWVYLGSGGSVLMAGLMHALFNGLVPLTNGVDPELAWTIRGVLWPLLAILVIALGGFRDLRTPASAGR